MDKRYQVFISSTFRDLIEARQKVLLALQKLNHIPVGMEFFPSANDAPWGVIERIIRFSDYYVLIIGGRYGSTDEEGISYTEREYDLAVKLEIPVLAFLHAAPEKIASGDSELSAKARKKLESFREKVSGLHHCDFWENADELATKVTIGLVNEIVSNPGAGWVRADFAQENTELLGRLESTRNENETLRQRLLASEQQLASSGETDELMQGTDTVTLILKERKTVGEETKIVTHEITRSWHEIFMAIAWSALKGSTSNTLKNKLAASVNENYYVEDDIWQQIAIQLLALGLISVGTEMRLDKTARYSEWSGRSKTRATNTIKSDVVPEEIWRLTEEGIHLLGQSSAIRRNCEE